MEIKTGMHIGASSEFSEIGEIDSQVIRYGTKNAHMIPESSLKGKIKTLLIMAYGEEVVNKLFEGRHKGQKL